jgi:hypothetical protein
MGLPFAERRSYFRIRQRIDVKVTGSNHSYHTRTKNISDSGALIEKHPLADYRVGDDLFLQLFFKNETSCILHTTVARTNNNGVGVKFSRIIDEACQIEFVDDSPLV